MTEKQRVQGIIIKLNRTRGYGFISSKAVPFERIYFHWTETKKFKELRIHQAVEFELINKGEPRGWNAINITTVPSKAPMTSDV